MNLLMFLLFIFMIINLAGIPGTLFTKIIMLYNVFRYINCLFLTFNLKNIFKRRLKGEIYSNGQSKENG